MILARVRDALAWRWRLSRRLRYLRKTFANGEALARSYLDKTPIGEAVLRDGTVIRHPPDRTGFAGMLLEIWHDAVYTGRFYTPRAGDVVVDAGANVGVFSALAARLEPACRVFAFEPFPENFEYLRANLAPYPNVTPVRAAVSAADGFRAMTAHGDRSQDHRLADSPGDTRVLSLGGVLAEVGSRVDLFKCDVEGSEWALFQGAADAELRSVRRWAIEYHEQIDLEGTRPGVPDYLAGRLSPSHSVAVKPDPGGYGMLYAASRSVDKRGRT